jgi:hypothetical protein
MPTLRSGESALGLSPLMPAALMIGHHFSISAFCSAPRASGVCCSRDTTSCPIFASCCCTAGSASAVVAAALSLAITLFGVPLGANSPPQTEMCIPGSPASSTVGMSGAEARRVGPVTA